MSYELFSGVCSCGPHRLRIRTSPALGKPGAVHPKGRKETPSWVLPHGLEPGTYLGTEFCNDQAVVKVIPAGQSGKRDRGAYGLEPRDRLGIVLNGDLPVGLAMDHIQRQVPQGIERDFPRPARDGDRHHKVRAELRGQMPGPLPPML